MSDHKGLNIAGCKNVNIYQEAFVNLNRKENDS